jgi:hypothetical protein
VQQTIPLTLVPLGEACECVPRVSAEWSDRAIRSWVFSLSSRARVICQVLPGQASDLAEYQIRRSHLPATTAAQATQHNAQAGQVHVISIS